MQWWVIALSLPTPHAVAVFNGLQDDRETELLLIRGGSDDTVTPEARFEPADMGVSNHAYSHL